MVARHEDQMVAVTKQRAAGRTARLFGWVSMAFATVFTGCADPLTEMVVVVDSDLRVPEEVDEIVVQASGSSGLSQDARAMLVGSEARGLPVSVALVPANGGAGPVTVRALARRAGTTVLAHEVRTSFLAGRRLLLRIDLLRACIAVAATCDGRERCVAGACVAGDVHPATLPAFDGAVPPRRDLGVPPPDASEDANAGDASDDASADDAGDDASASDAGPDTEAAVDGGDPADGSSPPDTETDAGDDAGTPCTSDTECALRGNPCVRGFCDLTRSRCAVTFTRNTCDDGNACTGDDTCEEGVCRGRLLIRCDDGNVCTTDACDPATGRCVYTSVADGTACELDGVANTCDACVRGSCRGIGTCPAQCWCEVRAYPAYACSGSDPRCASTIPEPIPAD
jgi:hypothetical protein